MATIPEKIREAATARAAGNSWPGVAAEIDWPLAKLMRWTRRNRREWNRLLRQARHEARTAAADEAISVLRGRLRDKNADLKFEAAAMLARLLADPKKNSPARRPRNAQTLYRQFAHELDSPIDEALQAAQAEIARSDRGSPEGPA